MASFTAPIHLSTPQTSWPEVSLQRNQNIKIHWSSDPFSPKLQYKPMRLVIHNTSNTHFTTSLAFPLRITITAYEIQSKLTPTHIRVIPINQGLPFSIPDDALPRPPSSIDDLPTFFSKHKTISEEMDKYIHHLFTQNDGMKSEIKFLAPQDRWLLHKEFKPACCLPPSNKLFPEPEINTPAPISIIQQSQNYGQKVPQPIATMNKIKIDSTTNLPSTCQVNELIPNISTMETYPQNYYEPLHINWMQLDLPSIEEEELPEQSTSDRYQQPPKSDNPLLTDIPESEYNSWTKHYLKKSIFSF
jgi:hypothetical protein